MEGGGEYNTLRHFFASHEIYHQSMCPYTHQQNGYVKHKHDHIVEMGLTPLAHSYAPFK